MKVVAKVTSRGQITIPRDIRVKMNLKRGDKIFFCEDNGKYIFSKFYLSSAQSNSGYSEQYEREKR